MTQSQLTNHIEMQKPVSEYKLSELAECKQISKSGLSIKYHKTRKSTQTISLLLLPKEAVPHTEQEETNRLAKIWCELLLGQLLEDRHQQNIPSAFEAKTDENIDSGERDKKYESTRTKHPTKRNS